jgi:hypothetical protein
MIPPKLLVQGGALALVVNLRNCPATGGFGALSTGRAKGPRDVVAE